MTLKSTACKSDRGVYLPAVHIIKTLWDITGGTLKGEKCSHPDLKKFPICFLKIVVTVNNVG